MRMRFILSGKDTTENRHMSETNTPSMRNARIKDIAEELIAARRDRQMLPSLLARHPGLSADEAYGVAEAICAHRLQSGEKIAGRKIGMTNRAVWATLETDRPIWGYVYDSGLVMAQGGRATASLAQATKPRIEPEIGFRLRKPVPAGTTDMVTLLRCVEWIAPCFELIDCHAGDWKFKAVEGIADFGVQYQLVVGEPLHVGETQSDEALAKLAQALGECKATLSRDGAMLEQGVGSNTLGHPLAALASLADVLAGLPNATPLKAGEVITSGTLTTPQGIAPGQAWRLELSGIDLKPLELRLS
jgi:2-oxo-3-hexenedioate decarboxylase